MRLYTCYPEFIDFCKIWTKSTAKWKWSVSRKGVRHQRGDLKVLIPARLDSKMVYIVLEFYKTSTWFKIQIMKQGMYRKVYLLILYPWPIPFSHFIYFVAYFSFFKCKKYTQSVLTSPKFHVCKFTYMLKFICNTQINICSISWSFMNMCRALKNSSHPNIM